MATKTYKVAVYDENNEVVAHVKYNHNLDVWNGSNWQNGGTGMHLGITMLKDGTPVLITGTQWQGQRDTARTVSVQEALQEVMQSDCAALEMILKQKKYAELAKLYNEKYGNQEREDDPDN